MTLPTLVPPVIDPSRTRIQEATSRSPFNIFNIVAIVLIVVIGFYLYKKYIDKPQRKFPMMFPVPVKMNTAGPAPTPAPVPAPEDEEEDVPEPPTDTEKTD
jgi:hypothetical protein